MALSKEGFKKYLTENGIDPTKATIESARAYKDSLKPTTEQLKTNIASGTTTGGMSKAQQNYQYNLATGDKQGARKVMLGSESAKNLNTTVNQEEVKGLSQEGILNPNITVETPPTTPVTTTETKVETPKTEVKTDTKPTTTTDITYTEDKTAFDPNKVISKAEQFTGTDGKTYQTVRNSDNTLTTIDVATGQAVTGKYTDTERDSIKQSFLQEKAPTDIKPTANDYYAQISQGLDIPVNEKNTLAYKLAYQRKLDLDKFSNMSSQDLAYSISQGQFLPGTQVYNDLKASNPQLVADAERLNSLNSINQPKKDVTDIRTAITDYITKLMNDDDKTTLKTTLSQNPELVKLNETLGEQANKLAEIKDRIDYAKEDMDKDYGSGSKSYKNFIRSEDVREMTRQYNLALAEYNTTAGQIQTLTSDIKYELEQQKADEQQKLQNLTTAYGLYQDMTSDERALDLNQKKLEQQYQYTYGDLDSTNPTLQNIAIERAVGDLYTKYPLPGMEGQATKVQKVKNLMAQGMSGSQALAQVENEIRSSERYKQYITPTTKYDFQNVGGDLYRTDSSGNISLAVKGKESNKWTKLDDGMYQDGNGNIITADEFKQQKLLTNNYLNADIGTNVGYECGGYAIRATGMTSVPGGNSLSDRIEEFKDTEPTLGGLVLFNGGNYDKTYGHIAVITGVNPEKGTITIKESNLKGDKKVTERTINAKASTISGFYNNTPLAGGGQEESLTDKQYTQYNQAYSKFVGNPLVKNFEESLTAGGDLIASLKADNGPGDVGAVFQFMKTLDPTSVVRESEFAVAQNTAGLKGKYENLYDKVLNGEKLTDDQRKAFGKVAFEYIKNKGKAYDIKYNDFIKVLKNQGIPESFYPTRMTDYIKEFEGTTKETKTIKTTTGKSYSEQELLDNLN